MMKLLYGIGVLAVICAGGSLSVCGMRWRQDGSLRGDIAGASVLERVHMAGGHGPEQSRDVPSPLVVQATAFALYLNPPKPPAPAGAPQPRATSPQPAPRPVVTIPKFRLLSTSCNHSYPEKSLALVSEPGKGDRWIRQGDHLGYLLVESVRDGKLVYRDGGQLSEMAVTMKPVVELAHLRSSPPVSTQSIEPDARLVNASRTNEPGIRVPDAGPADYE